jgi:hypothetical protein
MRGVLCPGHDHQDRLGEIVLFSVCFSRRGRCKIRGGAGYINAGLLPLHRDIPACGVVCTRDQACAGVLDIARRGPLLLSPGFLSTTQKYRRTLGLRGPEICSTDGPPSESTHPTNLAFFSRSWKPSGVLGWIFFLQPVSNA